MIRTISPVFFSFMLLVGCAARGQVLQLDAHDLGLTLEDGQVVTGWGPATGQGAPTFHTGQTPNGGPAISFDVGDHFGQLPASQFPPSGTGDWIVAAVIRPDSINQYHNIIDDDAQNRPMLWIDPSNHYELNFTGGRRPLIGTGVGGWDIVIADARNDVLYVNNPCANATGGPCARLNLTGTGGRPSSYFVAEPFDLFNRDGGYTYRGLVAELRVYTDPADFGNDFGALHQELFNKWFGVTLDTDGDGLTNDDEISIHFTDPSVADTDGDGLDDGCEVAIGTDPNVTDTDGDGLNDGSEVNVYGTDPNNVDTDGDGMTDPSEVAIATNPLSPPPGQVLQLDADDLDLTLADGQVVTGWGPAMGQGTPTFLTVQTPNGGPAVSFDDGDHFCQLPADQFPPSGTGDWIMAAVIRPDSINQYHNIIDDDVHHRPMLWIDPGNQYELNFSGGSRPSIGTGPGGWDIVIADSRNNVLYVNGPSPNGSGGAPISYFVGKPFDLFNRDDGLTYRGLVAELRVYTDPAAFGSDFAALYQELFDKWFMKVLVQIDIKPGSDPNCFNNDGNGVIPVAILGSSTFDVNEIVPGSVEVEGLDVKAVGKSNKLLAHVEDVNGDGFDDLVVQIEDTDRVFEPGDTTATLTGELFDGTPIEGTDSICIVP